jgi:Tfp pilus assembly protein PilX
MLEPVKDDRGMALMLVLMIIMLLSALMIGFMTSVMADTRSSGVDRDETQPSAAAHAGMEEARPSRNAEG